MTDPFDCIDTTWPAAAVKTAGGFIIRQGLGGGSRVSCASLIAPFESGSIDAVIAQHRAWGQEPKFMVRPQDCALDDALDKRGFTLFDPVTIYVGALCDMAESPAQTRWPPEPDVSQAWRADGIGPERIAVMDRVTTPKTVLVHRIDGDPVAMAFVAKHEDTTMLHALFTVPTHRRQGLGGRILRQAAGWAAANGTTHLALVVTRANTGANALYAGFGLHAVSHYHYRREAP